MVSRVKDYHLSEDEKRKYLSDFYSLVSSLKNREEIKNFFKDLLSFSEIIMISRRIQIAKMLLKNNKYEYITEKLGVGKGTISRVNVWLDNGFGGYRKTIMSLREKDRKINMQYWKNAEKTTPGSIGELKKRYPGHFLLLDIFEED